MRQRIEVPNKGDQLHSGDYVDVFLKPGDATNGKSPAATVAGTHRRGGEAGRRHGRVPPQRAGVLEPTPVRTGEAIGDRTVIREGLKPGDAVVVEGAFAVKAQMLVAGEER